MRCTSAATTAAPTDSGFPPTKAKFVARIDPDDYGYSTKVEQAGGRFATTVLPMVIAAAEAHLNRRLSPVWVDDMSGDGWDSVP
ncbi:hypothetical protein MycrhDRAFT_5506 [Mycolicibacterium rhodesiae JS60]|nr:hypothetical protein MycrhDRAFT_5506 [Mycolicibacterium rhodesiae JS60]